MACVHCGLDGATCCQADELDNPDGEWSHTICLIKSGYDPSVEWLSPSLNRRVSAPLRGHSLR